VESNESSSASIQNIVIKGNSTVVIESSNWIDDAISPFRRVKGISLASI
jgi:hypothetical protein